MFVVAGVVNFDLDLAVLEGMVGIVNFEADLAIVKIMIKIENFGFFFQDFVAETEVDGNGFAVAGLHFGNAVFMLANFEHRRIDVDRI